MELLEKPFRLNDRFNVTHVLGEGGQGTAYWGVDETNQQPVAVKRLDLERVRTWKSVDLFKREVAVLFQLNHAAIPTCIDGFRGSDHNFYLIEQYIEGSDLRKLQRAGKVWSDAELIKVMTDCLAVLAYLHGQLPSVIHRDIKPANIIEHTSGDHVLVDFGAVSLAMLDDNTGTTLIGTPGYMPIEQLSGKAVPASDLYSLGATIASLATGKRANELPVHRGKIQIERTLPPALIRSLDVMLEPIVEDRPQSVEALIGLTH